MNAKWNAYMSVRRLSAGAIGAAMVMATACSTLDVETLPAPGANLEGRSTFRIVERAMPNDSLPHELTNGEGYNGASAVESAVTHAMLNNSIVGRAASAQIARAFEARGYQMSETSPTFEISYFAGAMEREELAEWYGYPHSWGYNNQVDSYTEGMVLIDVRDPLSGDLLWRGSAEAMVSDEPDEYVEQLSQAIRKIVGRYPKVSPRLARAR